MHGQKRSEYKARLRDETTAKKLAQKAQQWNLLSSELLKRRRDAQGPAAPTSTSTSVEKMKDYNQRAEGASHCGTDNSSNSRNRNSAASTLETLKLTEKLLSVNPDPSHLWNHRMELLLSLTTNPPPMAVTTTTTAVVTMTPGEFIKKEREMTTMCLQRNPKAYGAWFHRKWAIQHWMQIMTQQQQSIGNNGIGNDNNNENDSNKLLKIELQQCAEFLNLDERNFHCWNYRRFVVSALACTIINEGHGGVSEINDLDGSWTSWCNLGDSMSKEDLTHGSYIGAQIRQTRQQQQQQKQTLTTAINTNTITPTQQSSSNSNYSNAIRNLLQDEWNFTTEKIRQNFSNGSAFHHRSKLISLLHPNASCVVESDLVRGELELIGNAIYTEPDDQTSWWYLRFIVDWADPNNLTRRRRRGMMDPTQNEKDSYTSMLEEQFECVRELVMAEEGQCKWGLLGMNMIATILYERMKGGEGDDIDEGEYDWKQEAYGCLETLAMLDPDRIVRYKSMMERYD